MRKLFIPRHNSHGAFFVQLSYSILPHDPVRLMKGCEKSLKFSAGKFFPIYLGEFWYENVRRSGCAIYPVQQYILVHAFVHSILLLTSENCCKMLLCVDSCFRNCLRSVERTWMHNLQFSRSRRCCSASHILDSGEKHVMSDIHRYVKAVAEALTCLNAFQRLRFRKDTRDS